MPKPRKEWRVDEREDVMIARVYGPSHADGYEYASLFETADKSMARMVVRAVNSHADLLEAVKAALPLLDYPRHLMGHEDCPGCRAQEVAKQIKTALAKVKGE